MAGVYVRKGAYKDGKFSLEKELFLMDEEKFEEECKKLDPYLIVLEETSTTSYDNSDDERAETSYTRIVKSRYREINPRENAKHMLTVDGKIVGVVFVVRGNFNDYTRAFSFDGSIAEHMRLGYSASHSSYYEYVDRVSLAKRGENGIPQTERKVRFTQSEMYPEL